MVTWVPCPTLAWACLRLRYEDTHHPRSNMPTQAWDMAPDEWLSDRSDPARPKSEPPPASPPPMNDNARRCRRRFPRPVLPSRWFGLSQEMPSSLSGRHSGNQFPEHVTYWAIRHFGLDAARTLNAEVKFGHDCVFDLSQMHICEVLTFLAFHESCSIRYCAPLYLSVPLHRNPNDGPSTPTPPMLTPNQNRRPRPHRQ